MKHGRAPKTEHPARTYQKKKSLLIVHDPDGDFSGAEIGYFEFCYSIKYGSWSDGLKIKRGHQVYTVHGKRIYNEAGNMCSMSIFDETGIITQRSMEAVCP